MLFESEVRIIHQLLWMAGAFVGLDLLVLAVAWRFVRKPAYTDNRFGEPRSVSGLAAAINSGISHSFDFKGRASRLEFWSTAVCAMTIWTTYVIVTLTRATMSGQSAMFLFLPIVWLCVAVPTVSVTVRRLHDINRTGWSVLLFFVFGHFLLLYWLCRPSQVAEPVQARVFE